MNSGRAVNGSSQGVTRILGNRGIEMAFIRKRISPSQKKTPSYQVIETYREGGKVKQRVLANLGCYPTPEKALSEFRRQLHSTRAIIEELKSRRNGASGSSGSRLLERNFEKWSRACARQLDTVEKLEALVSSGKKWGPQERLPSGASSNSTGFLDWVIDRNSNGWV